MSTIHKLKAYFGMIPADDVDGYDDEFSDDYLDERAGRYQNEFAGDQPQSARRVPARAAYRDDFDEEYEPTAAPRRQQWAPTPVPAAAASTRGSLAVEPAQVTRIRPVAQVEDNPLSRITTLHLRSYNEARTIGEPYRDGTPVIMNLTEMEDADAKRLVDFAAGLAFAMRGDIDKITSKVFLLSPPNVNVTAEVKGRIAEGGFFGRR